MGTKLTLVGVVIVVGVYARMLEIKCFQVDCACTKGIFYFPSINIFSSPTNFSLDALE